MASSEEEKKKKEAVKEFRWQPPQRDETTKEKFARKARENPFVPLGCFATVGALGYGLYSFMRGNARMQQSMMRARVLAQGSTLIAVIAGLGYELYSRNKKSQ